MLPSDCLLLIYSRQKHYSLGKVKLLFDLSLIIVAVVVSLWQSNFSEITGVREGSIIGSLLVGPIVQFILPDFAFFTKTSKVTVPLILSLTTKEKPLDINASKGYVCG